MLKMNFRNRNKPKIEHFTLKDVVYYEQALGLIWEISDNKFNQLEDTINLDKLHEKSRESKTEYKNSILKKHVHKIITEIEKEIFETLDKEEKQTWTTTH